MLSSEPIMVVVLLPVLLIAEVSIGKFCRLLGPVSASSGSLAVIPSLPRSIPSSPLENIELAKMALPVPAVLESPIPAKTLKAILLPAPTPPPIVLPEQVAPINTPEELCRAAVPLKSVPMKLFCTKFEFEFELRATPVPAFPEITLRAPAVVPPTVLFVAKLSMNTPNRLLPSATMPLLSVPMKLPCTRLLVAPLPSIPTPSLLPEIILRASAVVPPIRLLAAPEMKTPSPELPSAAVPLAFVPI